MNRRDVKTCFAWGWLGSRLSEPPETTRLGAPFGRPQPPGFGLETASRHLRLLTLLCVLLVPSSRLPAQTVLGPKGSVNPEQKQPKGQQPGDPIVYRLTVTPAAEPDPPLKYSLYPRWDELKSGNSVPMWYRALSPMDSNNRQIKPLNENLDRWFTDVLEDTPVDEIRPFLDWQVTTLSQARQAAFREKTDWDLRLRDLRGSDTIMFLLSEFQDARTLAHILSLRTRLSLLDGDFDAALADMTVAFRLAHDVAEPETFINDLIGIATIAITNVNIQHLIDTPGSPNLYWALAELPRPLIDLRPATQMEMTLPERYFPWLKDPAAEERTVQQWHQLLHDVMREFHYLVDSPALPGSDASELAVDVTLLGLTLRGYPTARRDLIDRGYEQADVDAMPVGKVIAIHQRLIYETLWQNDAAAALLPYQVAQQRFRELDRDMNERGYRSRPWQGRETLPIAGTLVPALRQIQQAQGRREVMRAALMVVEAIRMHLAAGDGQLPQSLEDIDVVPVPKNPWTEAPFIYELRGDVAVLDFALPNYHRQFEIRVDDGAAK